MRARGSASIVLAASEHVEGAVTAGGLVAVFAGALRHDLNYLVTCSGGEAPLP